MLCNLSKINFRNTDGHQSSPEVPDFKKARLGAGLPTPFAPPSGQPMESTLANLAVFMQSGNQVKTMTSLLRNNCLIHTNK